MTILNYLSDATAHTRRRKVVINEMMQFPSILYRLEQPYINIPYDQQKVLSLQLPDQGSSF